MQDLFKALIYIEPVVFRGDPCYFSVHIDDFILPLVSALRAKYGCNLTVGIASNLFLCLRLAEGLAKKQYDNLEVHIYPVYQKTALSAVEYNLARYCRDLYSTSQSRLSNTALYEHVYHIVKEFSPDLIATTSENRCLWQIGEQHSIPVLWIENCPLPRLVYPHRKYISVGGHINRVIQSLVSNAINNPTTPLATADALGQLAIDGYVASYHEHVSKDPRRQTIVKFIDSESAHGRLALLALQPEEWITWEGALGRSCSASHVILRALECMQSDKLIVTFHPWDARGNISAEVLYDIMNSDERLIMLPSGCSHNVSEIILPYVDEVLSVSSNVSIAAFLLGIRITSLGDSFVRTLADLQGCQRYMQRECEVRSYFLESLLASHSATHAEYHDPYQLQSIVSRMLNRGCSAESRTQGKESCIRPAEEEMSSPCCFVSARELHNNINKLLSDKSCFSPHLFLNALGRHILPYYLHGDATGIFLGANSGYFCRSLLHSGRLTMLYQIDPFGLEGNTASNHYDMDQTTWHHMGSKSIRMDGRAAFDYIKNSSVEFLYYEAHCFKQCSSDLILRWLPKLKPGGIMAGHGLSRRFWPGVYDKLEALLVDNGLADITAIPSVLGFDSLDMLPGFVARLHG